MRNSGDPLNCPCRYRFCHIEFDNGRRDSTPLAAIEVNALSKLDPIISVVFGHVGEGDDANPDRDLDTHSRALSI